jgi:hypothetical protein
MTVSLSAMIALLNRSATKQQPARDHYPGLRLPVNTDILCGAAANDKVFQSGNDATTLCGATCAAVCFEGATKQHPAHDHYLGLRLPVNADILCGAAANDKSFQSGKDANTVCGADCSGCFEGEPATNSSAQVSCAPNTSIRDHRDHLHRSICNIAAARA